jgi:hypothetical protein
MVDSCNTLAYNIKLKCYRTLPIQFTVITHSCNNISFFSCTVHWIMFPYLHYNKLISEISSWVVDYNFVSVVLKARVFVLANYFNPSLMFEANVTLSQT